MVLGDCGLEIQMCRPVTDRLLTEIANKASIRLSRHTCCIMKFINGGMRTKQAAGYMYHDGGNRIKVLLADSLIIVIHPTHEPNLPDQAILTSLTHAPDISPLHLSPC